MVDGERWYGPLQSTAEKAHEDAVEYRKDNARGSKERITIKRAFDQVETELKTKRSAGTLSWFKHQRRILELFWDPKARLSSIRPSEIEDFIHARLNGLEEQPEQGVKEMKPVSPNSVRHHLRGLSRVIRLAMRRGQISADPLAAVDLPGLERKRMDVWSPDEIREMLADIRKRKDKHPAAEADADIIEIAWLSGLRRAEIGRLRVEDVDTVSNHLHVRGKTGARSLPLEGRLRDLLQQLVDAADEGGLLVPGGAEHVASAFDRWRLRGYPRLRAHAMRHSFATALVRSGISVHLLASLMGHATIQMSMRYFHAHSGDARDAMRGLQQPSPAAAPTPAPVAPSETASTPRTRRSKRRTAPAESE